MQIISEKGNIQNQHQYYLYKLYFHRRTLTLKKKLKSFAINNKNRKFCNYNNLPENVLFFKKCIIYKSHTTGLDFDLTLLETGKLFQNLKQVPCICMAKHLCSPPETTTTLLVGYTPI